MTYKKDDILYKIWMNGTTVLGEVYKILEVNIDEITVYDRKYNISRFIPSNNCFIKNKQVAIDSFNILKFNRLNKSPIRVGSVVSCVYGDEISVFKIIPYKTQTKPSWDGWEKRIFGTTEIVSIPNDEEVTEKSPIAEKILGKRVGDEFRLHVKGPTKEEDYYGLILGVANMK